MEFLALENIVTSRSLLRWVIIPIIRRIRIFSLVADLSALKIMLFGFFINKYEYLKFSLVVVQKSSQHPHKNLHRRGGYLG